MRDFEGKTAFVTGGASGIGLGMAEAFVRTLLSERLRVREVWVGPDFRFGHKRGGDIHTYLAVKALAERHAGLTENFRSSQRLLDDIQRVFIGRRPHPFMEDGVAFTPVQAGRPGAELRLRGEPVPSLHFLRLPAAEDGKPLNIGTARLAAADRCADTLAGLLHAGRIGEAQVLEGGSQRALAEADIDRLS